MTIGALLNPRVEAALARLPEGLDPLRTVSTLRAELERPLAEAAAELHDLRRRATGKLSHAGRLFLTRKGLEQATDRRVARLRATRMTSWLARHAPQARVLDATAGIGGESMALLEAGAADLIAADASPDIARLLRRNLALCAGELGRHVPAVVCARHGTNAVGHDVLLLDPDRRAPAGKERRAGAQRERRGDPEHWSPAWSEIVGGLDPSRPTCIKLPPAVDVERLSAVLAPELETLWQWNSLGGELKEVALWTGPWASRANGEREVNALARDGRDGRDGSVHTLRASAVETAALGTDASRSVRWICEPDPGVIRAGLLGTLAAREDLAPLAPKIAYLGGDHPARSPLLASFEVLGSTALDRRRVRRLLAEHDVGAITVKKRGHPSPSVELEKRFRGAGSTRGLLIVVRLETGHQAYLVRRVRHCEPEPSGAESARRPAPHRGLGPGDEAQ